MPQASGGSNKPIGAARKWCNNVTVKVRTHPVLTALWRWRKPAS
jgi:hypothetical protein